MSDSERTAIQHYARQLLACVRGAEKDAAKHGDGFALRSLAGEVEILAHEMQHGPSYAGVPPEGWPYGGRGKGGAGDERSEQSGADE